MLAELWLEHLVPLVKQTLEKDHFSRRPLVLVVVLQSQVQPAGAIHNFPSRPFLRFLLLALVRLWTFSSFFLFHDHFFAAGFPLRIHAVDHLSRPLHALYP